METNDVVDLHGSGAMHFAQSGMRKSGTLRGFSGAIKFAQIA